ncbi:MAG: hypothetical protein AVDCRST_MAG50-802, partial [uncultured Acidimicrobiales bacterium]
DPGRHAVGLRHHRPGRCRLRVLDAPPAPSSDARPAAGGARHMAAHPLAVAGGLALARVARLRPSPLAM